MIAMGSVAGSAGALLWRLRSRVRNAQSARISAAPLLASVPKQLASPWRAVRVALGPPYAPASWQRRGIQLGLLGAVVAGAPIFTLLYERSLRPRALPAFVLHTVRVPAASRLPVGCTRYGRCRACSRFSVPKEARGPSWRCYRGWVVADGKLRRLCLVALGVLTRRPAPVADECAVAGQAAAGCARHLSETCSGIPAHSADHTANSRRADCKSRYEAYYWSRSTLHGPPRHAPSHSWCGRTFGIWTYPPQAWGHTLRLIEMGLVLTALMVLIGFSIPPLRKLLQRPHPFVEISS